MILVILAILLYTWCSSASLVQGKSPTTVRGLHNILKREHVIECENIDAQYGPPRVAGFRISSVKDICLNYPHGLGAFCSGENIEFREPRNPLYFQAWVQGGGGLSSLCRRLCQCHDLAPEIPSAQEEPDIKGEVACSEDEGEVSSRPYQVLTSQGPETAQCLDSEDLDSKTRYPRQFTCNAAFYGHPESADCEAAIRKLPDWGDATHAIRQYFETGDTSIHTDSTYFAQEIQLNDETLYSFRNRVRTPVMLSSGACNIAVMLPEDPGKPTQRAFVGSQSLINAAEDLRSQCVDHAASGGKFDHLWFMDGNLLIPNIIMFEKGSLMEDWLTLKMTELITSSESSQQTACSGSCMDPNDCDINSDCVCASDKPIPLSSTWGQHACMYVAGAALAHVQATVIKPFSRCHGRCLPEDGENGNSTTRPANITSHVPIASSASFANETAPISPSLAHVPHSHSGIKHSLANNSLSSSSNKSAIASNPTVPESTNDLDKAFQLPTPNLTCPCNCTYVSASCCLSPLVWENPSQQVHMDPLPANGTVCCNATSGKWMAKKSIGGDCNAFA